MPRLPETYADWLGVHMTEHSVLMPITRPQPASIMPGTKAFAMRTFCITHVRNCPS
jgi:hypothetical protein